VTYRPAKLVTPTTEDDAASTAPKVSSPTESETLSDSTEMEGKLEDVRNGEAHRVKDGRAIKATA
jgi:hypothetical protein